MEHINMERRIMEMKSIKATEVIYTFQGEGPDVGKRMLLIRQKRCNRDCSWCDTKVKNRVYLETDYSFTDIQSLANEKTCGLMLTGGEPTFGLNLERTASLINDIDSNLYNVETNGLDLVKLISKVNPNKNVKYMLSPKLFGAGDSIFYSVLVLDLKGNDKVYIKLVCENNPMVIEFLDYLKDIKFPNERVYLMPEGTTRDDLINHSPFVFDMCEKYNFNFSSRSHIIYGFI
jgi:organic radical activating enzyme